MEMMNPGWVYILTNRSLQSDYLKIGRTANDPSDRASDISGSTGVATPFEVAYVEAVPDCVRAETLVHRQLSDCRVNNNREFFHLDLSSAQETVHTVCEQVRDESVLCKQCRTKAYLSSTKAELSASEAEIDKLQETVRETVAERERIATRYGKLRRRVRSSILTEVCRTAHGVFAHVGRMTRLCMKAFRAQYVKLIPDLSDRRIITWVLIVPVGFGGWIALLVLEGRIALGIALTLLVIAAVTIMAEAQKQD
jgi:hypothetical protein